MLVKPISVLLPSSSALEDIDGHVKDAKYSFAEMRATGQYAAHSNQMYIYRITDQNRSYTGILLGVASTEFQNDVIVHHERTISRKVTKQTKVALAQSGFSKPILLTNRPIPAVTEIMKRYVEQVPTLDTYLKKYKAQHQLWAISDDQDIKSIVASFHQKTKTYIVDGHHRTRAIETIGKEADAPFSSGLCAMFDIDELEILSFHRIVDIGISSELFIDALSCIGDLRILKEPRTPKSSNEIVILHNMTSYSFTWSAQTEKKNAPILDVKKLSTTILRDILSIEDESKSPRIRYVEGSQSIEQIQSRMNKPSDAAFLLHPISIDSFITLLNDGMILPPKSTFFTPRMANGVVSMAW